ncbi:MAG: redoxin domain-containing protein [Firmicutes bacterium]|nr:redoxin domain-containing protein [Bacillota bacterium]
MSKKTLIVVGVCLFTLFASILLTVRYVSSYIFTTKSDIILYADETDVLKIGRTMPDTRLVSLRGQNIMLSQIINKQGATLICFFSLGCPPCLEELKMLKKYYRTDLVIRNVKVICISGEGLEHLIEFTRKQSLPFEFFASYDWTAMRKMYDLPGTPYNIILSAGSMKVQWLNSGYSILTYKGKKCPELLMYLRKMNLNENK